MKKRTPLASTVLALLLFSLFSLASFSSSFAQQLNNNNSNDYSFVTKWGSFGSGFGKFSQPLEIATDSAGNIYVTDFTGLANQVQKFSPNGTFIFIMGFSWNRCWRLCKSA